MTLDEFLTADLTQVSQSYLGKDRCCRCGCSGDYVSTSYHRSPRSRVDDRIVKQRINRAKRLIREGAKAEVAVKWINVELGNNRALTFYFDELK